MPFDPHTWLDAAAWRSRTRKAQRAARRSSRDEQPLEARVRELEQALERSQLLSLALWQLVSERLPLTAEELTDSIAALDARGGPAYPALEGSGEPLVCGECQRPNAEERYRCLFCGAGLTASAERWRR